jgi:hypothetical protein
MPAVTTPISEQERAARQAAAERALASVRLEGLEPTDSAKLIFQRYISGELAIDELMQEIQALNARKFGPLRVPGN